MVLLLCMKLKDQEDIHNYSAHHSIVVKHIIEINCKHIIAPLCVLHIKVEHLFVLSTVYMSMGWGPQITIHHGSNIVLCIPQYPLLY